MKSVLRRYSGAVIIVYLELFTWTWVYLELADTTAAC